MRSREALRDMIQLYCKGVEVVAEAESVKSGIEAITHHTPDLVMLDIKMPDGSGFDLIRQLIPVNFRIIFVTAYEEYAITAFRYNAIDYITKPIDPVELQDAIAKATANIEKENLNIRLKKMLEDYAKPQADSRKIILKTVGEIHVVDVDRIIRCESDRNYTLIRIIGMEDLLISKSINKIAEILEPYNFYRVHHSHLINLKYIVKFKRDELMCVLFDNAVIPVATRKKDDLIRVLMSL